MHYCEGVAYPEFDESTVHALLFGHRVLIGHLLCKYGGSVGFTYSLEVTVCPYEAHEVNRNVVNYC
jgi:hypothetical protein